MMINHNNELRKKRRIVFVSAVTLFVVIVTNQRQTSSVHAFSTSTTSQLSYSQSYFGITNQRVTRHHHHHQILLSHNDRNGQHEEDNNVQESTSSSSSMWLNQMVSVVSSAMLIGALTFGAGSAAFAENELSAKYGGKGLDTSLVDQTCLINQCSVQAKACLQDDPSCRKGLTCTAKCLGDNSCITGCMARYGNTNLDHLLKCTIEDNECIKIAILPGGADTFTDAPLSPAPVVSNFNVNSMTGSWYKVVGYNPNYDCYACQRNTFTSSTSTSSDSSYSFINNNNNNKQLPQLQMDVEFSMPHLLPDGSPLPPSSIRESLRFVNNNNDNIDNVDTIQESTMLSIGLNDYKTRETMIFDQGYMGSSSSSSNSRSSPKKATNSGETTLTLNKGTDNELNFHRTAHSEGEMFGLKFWENWYIIGENNPGEEEFKFVYYNGKTRQNTYSGAFVYSRTKELSTESLKKVYNIANIAGMDPTQFCRIRNGCFVDEPTTTTIPNSMLLLDQQEQEDEQSSTSQNGGFFRGMIASTRISEMLGVEPVAARDTIRSVLPTAPELTPESLSLQSSSLSSSSSTLPIPSQQQQQQQRPWWNEMGDYFENPHRHFQVMDTLRAPMIWPDDVVNSGNNR